MPKLQKRTGNFREMFARLGIAEVFGDDPLVEARSKDEETVQLHQIKRDLDTGATTLCVERHDFTTVKREIEQDYLDHKTKSYIQGQLTGRLLGVTFAQNKNQDWFVQGRVNAHDEGTEQTHTGTLDTVFYNDRGVLCGFSIDYVRDDSKADTVSVQERPFLYVVTIIENVTNAPENRQVSCFIHDDLWKSVLTEDDRATLSGEELDTGVVKAEVDRALSSAKMTKMLDGLFVNGVLSLRKFNALNRQFEKNRQYQLTEKYLDDYQQALSSYTQSYPDLYQKGMSLYGALETILRKPEGIKANKLDILRRVLENSQAFLRDPHAPAAKTYLTVLAEHAKQLNKETNPLWKRLGAALLGLVGVGLVLVGVLATVPTGPLGIAVIAAGVALIAGGTTLATTTSLSKERKLAHALTLFHSSATTVEKTVDVIKPFEQDFKVKRVSVDLDSDPDSDAIETPTSVAQSPSS